MTWKRLLGRVLAAFGIAFFSTALLAQAAAEKLYLFNYSHYMNPKLIAAFEKKFHVQVVQNYFESNPELFAKLRAGGDSQYDVVVASNYYVPRLIHTGLIQPLNKTEIPNYSNLLPRFRKTAYDPQGKYSAAYQWGDTGIVYNTKTLGKQRASWGILFDPKMNSKYPFALGTDAQVMMASACAYQGHGYACTSRDHLKQAAQLLLKTKKRRNFASFENGTPVLRQLARGNLAAGVTYNGDFLQYKEQNPKAFKNMRFVVPKEGAELWVDTMDIPAHAPHPKLANQFISFVLDAKNGARLSHYTHYASPNQASRPYLDAPLQRPPSKPTRQQMKHLHYTPVLKGDQLQFVQQLWTEIKSR